MISSKEFFPWLYRKIRKFWSWKSAHMPINQKDILSQEGWDSTSDFTTRSLTEIVKFSQKTFFSRMYFSTGFRIVKRCYYWFFLDNSSTVILRYQSFGITENSWNWENILQFFSMKHYLFTDKQSDY